MRNSKRWLVAIVVAHLAMGVVYLWATPMFEASDEGVHYAVVRWLAQGNGLPIQRPDGPKTTYEQQGSQPPLYYALSVMLTGWVDTSDFELVYVRNPLSKLGVPGTTHNVTLYRPLRRDQPAFTGTTLAVTLIRLFSLGLSCVTITFTFLIARRLFPENDLLALLASALAAFNPMVLFINASVNNDNLLMMLSTVSLWAILPLAQPQVERFAWKAAGLGVLLGLVALSKVSGLVLWPIAALGVAWGAWQARDWRRFVVGGVLIAGIAVLISGWWFWRNLALYGELLGTRTMVAVAGPRMPPLGVGELITQEWEGFYLSYWGVFGVFSILPGRWAIAFFAALTIVALIGLGWIFWRERFWRRVEVWLGGVFILATLISLINWTLQTLASQGRLMFGAIAPLSIFMALGLITVFARWAHVAAFGLAGTLALVAVIIPVADIAPRYAPPPALAEAQLPAALRPVHATINDTMELIGYTGDMAPRRPGETQPVTLYWRALKPMEKDYALALLLFGRHEQKVSQTDSWPGAGLAATSQWTPGMILADTYHLPIDVQAEAPSLLRLSLAVWDAKPSNRLPIVTPDGEARSSVTLVVGRIVPERDIDVAPEQPNGSTFEHGITLLGVDVGLNNMLTLYWALRADQPVPADYTVFAHVFDANGQKVTQADGPPLNDDWPTTAWVPGQTFAEVRRIDLPADLPAGRYSVRLGFYDPAQPEARLFAYHPDGLPWPDNAVVLENVIEAR